MHSETEEIFLIEKLILGGKETLYRIHRLKWEECLGKEAKIFTRISVNQKKYTYVCGFAPGLHPFVCSIKGQVRVSLHCITQVEFWGILKIM